MCHSFCDTHAAGLRKSNSSWVTALLLVWSVLFQVLGLLGLLLFVPSRCAHFDICSAGVSVCVSFCSHTIRFSLFSLMVICSFHLSFPLYSPCCGAIQQELAATLLSTSLSLFQRRPDLCWSRWESRMLPVTYVCLYFLPVLGETHLKKHWHNLSLLTNSFLF